MFKIYDGREHFYQWDIDRKLIVNDSINQVHFCNRTDDCSLVCEVYEEDGLRLVNVPNVLLQDDWRINVYGYDKNYTKFNATFDVIKRTKPTDYVYTETEVVNWETIEEKLDAINENIDSAVSDYLDENPVQVDLADYYTKEEVDQKLTEVDVAVDVPNEVYIGTTAPNDTNVEIWINPEEEVGFVTMTEVEAKGYQTEAQVNALINTALGVIENGTY